MKTINKISSSFLIGFLTLNLVMLVQACSGPKAEEQSEIAALLARNSSAVDSVEFPAIKVRYEKAKEQLTKDANNTDAIFELAEIFINEARITGEHPHYYPAALSVLKKAEVIKNPAKDIRFRMLTLRSSVEMSLHQFDKAIQSAEEAIALNPYNAGIYGVMVDALVELGKYEEAVKTADKMVSIRPDLRSYSRISYLREIHGDIPGAIEAMQMAVKAGYPGYEATAWASYNLGKLLENYGDTANARKAYQMTLLERPDYAFATAGLASLEVRQLRYNEAEKLYQNAIQFMPEVSFYHELAGVYQKTGRRAESEKMGRRILEMMEEDEASGHNMALEKARVYLDLLNQPENAKEVLKNELSMRPDNIDVNLCMAKVCVKLKDYTAMEKHLQLASKTNSIEPELLALKMQLDKNPSLTQQSVKSEIQ